MGANCQHGISAGTIQEDGFGSLCAGTEKKYLLDQPARSSRRVSASMPALSNPEEGVTMLAWKLDVMAGTRVLSPQQISKLHEHITECCDMFESEIVMEEAAAGYIRGHPVSHSHMNEKDVNVRLGQLICRWAQTHKLGVRAGVACGDLHSVALPSSDGKVVFYGTACQEAMKLADSCPRDHLVHMSNEVRDGLSALRLMRVTISQSRLSYYLDPATNVRSFFTAGGSGSTRPSFRTHLEDGPGQTGDSLALQMESAERMSVLSGSTEGKVNVSGADGAAMTLQAFEALLRSYKVDTSCFGKGAAKTLGEFYEAVVRDHKCYLVLQDGHLERVVNLCRISLRIRDHQNKLRELRIKSQATGDGGLRMRDQPLAVVLQSGPWQEALEACFEQKLQIPTKVQKSAFAVDMESHTYKEDRSTSETIPGIMTTYQSHNIIVNIKDKNKKELQHLGLPDGVDFKIDGAGNKTWTWELVGNKREDELMEQLQTHGVDVSEFSPQAFAELYDEVYDSKLSTLEVAGDGIVRTIRIIKVWLHASIQSVDHVLCVKAKWQKGQFDAVDKDRPISMRMSSDQDWEDAVEEALMTRLGLTLQFQNKNLTVDHSSHKITEESGYSRSYPGLKTIYVVNEVSVHVLADSSGQWQFIGLPSGTDFTFARREQLKGPETEDMVVTHWCWKFVDELEKEQQAVIQQAARSMLSVSDAPEQDKESAANSATEEEVMKRRVDAPPSLFLNTAEAQDASPVAALSQLMRGAKTDWTRAKQAAKRMRDPEYTTRNFYEDVRAAFPELALYCVVVDQTQTGTSSGRAANDEYQRTIGALFAVFWLMRLDIDGKECFSFGLNSHWKPRKPEQSAREQDEVEKRKAFYKNCDWDNLQKLVVDAGLLVRQNTGTELVTTHDPERTLAMLVLMSIHDIMKISTLCPKVGPGLTEFNGYRTGEMINDHDAALSYVLTHHASLLPSFMGLKPKQQDSIKFTHCKLEYNMGWLVQAEAPPGALFRTFKQVVLAGKAPASDVAFYFVHWFTDLAAAEPCPLEGCEKFVLKFPQRVLTRFVESFSIVQSLSTSKNESQVLEDYLCWRWTNHQPSLGPPPKGQGAIAKMRLMLMAQGDSKLVTASLDKLNPDDKNVICEEMAVTGCAGQMFERHPFPENSPYFKKGPAILIYYSPALMQKAGRKDPVGGLCILAEVWRRARELWPLTAEEQDSTVIVRIDNLKELECPSIQVPEANSAWIIGKTSGKDAMVKLVSVDDVKHIDWNENQTLTFSLKPKRKRRISKYLPGFSNVALPKLW